MAMTQDTERAEDQARAQLDSIIEMVQALDTEDDDAREAAEQTIQEDALSVQVRSGWYSPGTTPEAEEYEILLCTGGPAVRITGQLGRYNEPDTARIEYQDWFTPWTEFLDTSAEEGEAVLTYAQQFFFGS